MDKGMKVEVEDKELFLVNEAGDKVIIPKDKAAWVKEKLKEGCHSCIDALVDTLPVMEDYAESGTLIANGDPPIVSSNVNKKDNLNVNLPAKSDFGVVYNLSTIFNDIEKQKEYKRKFVLDALDVINTYYNDNNELYDPANYNLKDYIPLTVKRYNTGKLPKDMLDEAYDIAQQEGIDVYDLLSVMGRESTFDVYAYGKSDDGSQLKKNLVSGWNLDKKYVPISFDLFLANKKLPFCNVKYSKHGIEVDITDEEAKLKYLEDNPKVFSDYANYVRSVPKPDYGEYNSLVEVARMIKNNQMHKYNPGDKGYLNKLRKEKDSLKMEVGIAEYLESKSNKNSVGNKDKIK